MKKCFYLILTLLSFSCFVLATPISRIKGKIVDASNNNPIDAADVFLFRQGNANPIYQALPEMDGSFNIPDIKDGTYSLLIRLVGYDLYSKTDIEIIPSRQTIDLGIISLKPLEVGLAEVEIVAHYSLNTFSEIQFYKLSLYISYLQIFSFGLHTHKISRF